jgi:uncharacterized protein (UPF0332 family)
MAFDWKEFIKFSEELYDSRNDEASLRSAISRAYYGAFGAIRPYCIYKFQISAKSNHEIHRTIIDKLKSSSDRLEYSTGNFLSGLRDERNNADYDSSSSITKPNVNKAINVSKAVISNLENLRKQL